MRYKAVIDTIGWVLILFSFSLFLPLITGYIYHEPADYLIISYLVPFFISFFDRAEKRTRKRKKEWSPHSSRSAPRDSPS